MTSDLTAISPSEKIQVKLYGHIAILTINNPPANTWDRESLSALTTVVNRLNARPEISALVIHGQGSKFFSAGADLNQFSTGDKDLSSEVANRFGEAFEALAGFNGDFASEVAGEAG